MKFDDTAGVRCGDCGRLSGWRHMTHDVPGCECAECASMCWGDPWDCRRANAERLPKALSEVERLTVERDAALAEVARLQSLVEFMGSDDE